MHTCESCKSTLVWLSHNLRIAGKTLALTPVDGGYQVYFRLAVPEGSAPTKETYQPVCAMFPDADVKYGAMPQGKVTAHFTQIVSFAELPAMMSRISELMQVDYTYYRGTENECCDDRALLSRIEAAKAAKNRK